MPDVQASADLMSPLNLFLQADLVVKIVMVGLLLASIWTWAIIFTHTIRLKSIYRKSERFEQEFWATSDIDAFHGSRGNDRLPIAAVMSAAMDEWRRSTKTAQVDRAGTRERLASRMNAAVASEVDRLSDRLNILATVGSVAPFVGLFGTVWGIMRSFTGIAASNNTSLAVVAPGIAEALFATAIGLFAAIPAVIAYNRLTHGLDRLEARLGRFADRFHGGNEQLADDRGDAVEMAGPMFPFPAIADPRHPDRRRESGRVELVGRRHPQIVAARFLQLGGIFRLLPGIARQVARVVELQRIDEDRRDRPVRPGLRRLDQRQVPGMQRAHGRNQRDYFTGCPRRRQSRRQIA